MACGTPATSAASVGAKVKMSLTTRFGSNPSIHLAKARAAAAAVCPSGVSGPGGGYTEYYCAPVNPNPSASTGSRHRSQLSTSTS